MNKSARPPLAFKPLSYTGGLSSLQNTPRSLQPPASVHSSAASSLQSSSKQAPHGTRSRGASGGDRCDRCDQAICSDDNGSKEFCHHGSGLGKDSKSSHLECIDTNHSPSTSASCGCTDGRIENAMKASPKSTSYSVREEMAANESRTSTSMSQVTNLDTNSTPFWLINGPGHHAAAGGYYWQEQWRQRQQTGELTT